MLLVAALAAGAPAPAAEAPPMARPSDHVFVVMLDGTRPDALRTSHAPNMRALEASGAHYLQARTIYPSQTRVAFVSLPTGAYPSHHGITGGDEWKDPEWRTVAAGNDDPVAAQSLVLRPTVFEEATAAGLTSVYAAMKGYELVGARGATWTINGKKTIDRQVYDVRYDDLVHGSRALGVAYKQEMSRDLLRQLLALVREKKPNLVVVNLGSADYVAHSYGPRSPEYGVTLEVLDGLIGELLKTLGALGIRERSTIVVSADHGFSSANGARVVAPVEAPQLAALTGRGIEHFVTNTGGQSIGLWVRDKAKVAEAVLALRAEPWVEALYCEDAKARCDRRLSDLGAWAPGRSPDVSVDIDDDATASRPRPGNHGSLRDDDSRIPLVLSGAGVVKGGVFGRASLVDVAPTVVRLLGLPGTVLRPDGRVLEEALAGGTARPPAR